MTRDANLRCIPTLLSMAAKTAAAWIQVRSALPGRPPLETPGRRPIARRAAPALRGLCAAGFLALILASSSAPARAGTTYAYNLSVGNFLGNTDPSTFGMGDLETIFLNNGNSTNTDQTYSYSDILGVALTSIGGTFDISAAQPQTLSFTGNPSDTFATTDAQGMLALIPPFSVNVVTTDSATISVNGGAESITISAWWFTGTWQGEHVSDGNSAFGALSTAPVPEPASLSLVVIGGALIALGRLRKRKQALQTDRP